MWPQNKLTDRLNLKWPIFQAPMGELSTPVLASAVSNAGGLGGLGMWGFSAEEAVRTARLARELGMPDWFKLEVIGDKETLMPDNEETLKATKILVKEDFAVLAYTDDDIIYTKKIEEAGATSVISVCLMILL